MKAAVWSRAWLGSPSFSQYPPPTVLKRSLSCVLASGGQCDREILLQVSSDYAFGTGVGRPCCLGIVAAQCGFAKLISRNVRWPPLGHTRVTHRRSISPISCASARDYCSPALGIFGGRQVHPSSLVLPRNVRHVRILASVSRRSKIGERSYDECGYISALREMSRPHHARSDRLLRYGPGLKKDR